MRNFHLPLPEETYRQLQLEAQRAQVPATSVARTAIDSWLRHQMKKARHDAIADFARSAAGSQLDLDPLLEAAAVEHLTKTARKRK